MSEIKEGGGGAAETTQLYIIQPTIAFVSVCMAKIQYALSSTNS